jgi:hypothetical protein
MPYSVLMAMAALAGLFYMTKAVKKVRIIIAFQLLAVIMILCPDSIVHTAGIFVYILSLLIILVYSLYNELYDSEIKLHYVFITVPVFIIHTFILFKWPYAEILGLIMVVPLLSIMVLYSTRKRTLKGDIGLLVIIAADALIRLFITLEWMAFFDR